MINNPFTYRGYYYDSDLGLYYLQTRYYDSETARFINADSFVSTGQGILGNNMFAYCGNNPVNGIDPFGEWTFSIGFNFFAGLIKGIGGSFGLSCAHNDKIAGHYSYSKPSETSVAGASASLGVYFQFTDLKSTKDLERPTLISYGVNTPLMSFDIIEDEETNEIHGIIIGLGPSIGADYHETGSKTKALFRWSSLFDLMKGLF